MTSARKTVLDSPGECEGHARNPDPGRDHRQHRYLTDSEMTAFLVEKCVPAYKTYTGINIETETVYDIAWFQPTTDGLKKGDQGVTCYLYRLDEAPFKGSLKAG